MKTVSRENQNLTPHEDKKAEFRQDRRRSVCIILSFLFFPFQEKEGGSVAIRYSMALSLALRAYADFALSFARFY